MAFVDDSLFDEEEQNDLSGDAGSPQVPGGGLGSAGTGSTNASASGETPGRFADLSEYLRVNDDQNFGSQLASKVGEDINQAQSTLGNVEQDFRSRVDANTVRDDAGLINQVQSAPQSIDQDQFARLRDAQYGGPSSLSETPDLYSQSQSASQTATSRANASKTEPGRFALLDNYFGRPNYTQGEKSLDNLLVQNDADSQQAFNQMRENANQLAQNQQQMGQNLNTFAAQSKADTQGTRARAREALGIDDDGNYVEGLGAIGQERGDVLQTLQGKQSELDRIRQALEQGDFSSIGDDVASTLDRFGNRAKVTNIGDFIDVSEDFTESGLANNEQQSRLAALSRLAGIDNVYADGAGEQLGNEYYNFDKEGFEQAVLNKEIEPLAAQLTNNMEASFTKFKQDVAPIDQRIGQLQKDIDAFNQQISNPTPFDIMNGNLQRSTMFRDELLKQKAQLDQQRAAIDADYQQRLAAQNAEMEDLSNRFGVQVIQPRNVPQYNPSGNVIRTAF